MQLPLFQALQSIKIDDDKATKVVEALEGYVSMSVREATAPILAKLDTMSAERKASDEANKARFDSLNSTITSQKWVFSAIAVTFGIVIGLLNFFHVHP